MYPQDINLNGEWDFFYSPQPFFPQESALPPPESFTGRMVVPGYWDDHYELYGAEDFFGLTARFNPDYRKPFFPMARSLTPHASSSFLIGTGFYRYNLAVPEDFVGGSVTLNVGPAMWGCAVFCNGRLAGNVTGYSVASSFEIGDLLKRGESNELIIAVCNYHDDGGAYHRLDGSHDGQPFGCRPGQHRGLAAQGYQSERGGIGGGVSLHISGAACIRDWFVSNEEPGRLHWHFTLGNAEKLPEGASISWAIRRSDDSTFDCGSVPCPAGSVEFFSGKVPPAWSDRNPELCTLEVALLDGKGEVLDRNVRRWAPCRVECRGVSIFVNDVNTYFRGATEHCYFAETCNPHFDREKYLHDLGVLKAAGFNFIRCHTWCPPEPFYDACDELGIFVQTELPSVWSFPEAEEVIRMVRRHVCAVIFCEGNEKYFDNTGIDRLRRLAALVREMAPGMLFNPQEAIRGVEYGFTPDQKLCDEPFQHDPERFAAIAEFSDLYGSLGAGCFSYGHDFFPGTEEVERIHSLYRKPCLSHEIGILGGYLDFSLEERYEGTFIGTDMFRAARDNMKRNGVWENARDYYELNTRFISSIRKQLVENIRSCPSIAGYDYLGGIDTHWHLTGYPCGIFNEFYEEKYGETIADVKVYNGESILINGRGKFRTYQAGVPFEFEVKISHYGAEEIPAGKLNWSLCRGDDGGVVASGQCDCGVIAPGTVGTVATIAIDMPEFQNAVALKMTAEVAGVANSWNIWVYPRVADTADYGETICTDRLTPELVDKIAAGASVLLIGNLPGEAVDERFGPHTSGRSLGHSGLRIHQHPIWQRFPHVGFGDWQFYSMMQGSRSLVNDREMPEFAPLIELMPSFKLITRKSMLSEYRVGAGRLMVSGMIFDGKDPASIWLKHVIMEYLTSGQWQENAPEWKAEELKERVSGRVFKSRREKKIDAGGRVIE